MPIHKQVYSLNQSIVQLDLHFKLSRHVQREIDNRNYREVNLNRGLSVAVQLKIAGGAPELVPLRIEPSKSQQVISDVASATFKA